MKLYERRINTGATHLTASIEKNVGNNVKHVTIEENGIKLKICSTYRAAMNNTMEFIHEYTKYWDIERIEVKFLPWSDVECYVYIIFTEEFLSKTEEIEEKAIKWRQIW